MDNPSDFEITKTIAKFMGSWDISKDTEDKCDKELLKLYPYFFGYIKSLDKLVPVVEKLKYGPEFIYCVPKEHWTCTLWYIFTKETVIGKGTGKTMSEALALACYRVIKSKEDKTNEDIN